MPAEDHRFSPVERRAILRVDYANHETVREKRAAASGEKNYGKLLRAFKELL
jgi:hypothetical protein